MESASSALSRGDLTAADAALRQHLITAPDDVAGLELAGDVAAGLGDPSRAVGHYRDAIAAAGAVPSESLLYKLAVALMTSDRAYDCLQVLRERAEQYPQNAEAHAEWVGPAAMLGVAPQAIPSMRWLVQHGKGDPELLQVLADPRRVEADGEWCRELLTANPDDLRPEYGLAQIDAVKLRWDSVIERLRPVIEKHPDFIPAQILFGLALIEQGHFDELTRWHQQVPEAAQQTAGYWLVAGLWARQQKLYPQSAHAFWNALRLDQVSYPEALSHLRFVLIQIGREQEANRVSDYMTRRTILRDRLKTHFERQAKSQRAAMEVAKAMKNLGRLWEAEGWARLAFSLPEQPVTDIRGQYTDIRSGLTVKTPWQLPRFDLGRRIDLSGLPAIEWPASVASGTGRSDVVRGELHFAERAEELGLVHQTEFAETAGGPGHAIYQSVGGGAGVVDFDLDGWPDLAVAVLDGQPLQADSSPNRLFRNLDGRFAEVTTQAEYLDRGFGQGLCVGDFNEDGFPDLFDANIGQNRLYRNNGDGTFREVSQQAGLDGEDWTTCGLLSDIDNDGIADLFEVAYCAGTAPYTKMCRNRQGVATCKPLDFDAQPDRVWRGRGDGTFEEVSSAWMTQHSPGRGLGIVAGRIDQQPGLDLYIANDMTVNHLWSARPGDEGFDLVDRGLVCGLGVSGGSQSQASMGIAAGDPDRDGDLDFFLSHFANDHNTYYEQVAAGFWVDRSFQVGLAQPSMAMLGFGTEWADFDNNGTLELVVTNGHVDDVDQPETMYRMPPQLFQLENDQRWAEVDRESLGSYFNSNHLGRALVTLDADRDGRVDLAITEIYGPLAMLMNESQHAGKFVDLDFTATGSHRDAIGAELTCRIGSAQVTMQLMAGDGYMCSNQRRLHMGTGDASELTDVTVSWPSGLRESFGALSSENHYRLIEGAGEAFAYRRQR